jgi:DNA-binding MarR family transcriptional regulator
MTTPDNRARLGRALASLMERLYAIHPDMTITQFHAFAHIAANPGITQRELIKLVGSSNDSTASRTLGILTEYGNRNVDGLKLVKMRDNDEDRRVKNCYLTPKGERLLSDILTDFRGIA